MSVFLVLKIIGLIGLVMMSIPGLNRHGHAHIAGHGALRIGHAPNIGHGAAHVGQGGAQAGHALGGAKLGGPKAGGQPAQAGQGANAGNTNGLFRLIPSPRMIFSLLTLYGGFGEALTRGLHMDMNLAYLIALIPAALFERFVVTPCWNALMQFEGQPSSPLENLTFQEAEAVTPFRNGKGMVSVERDGRQVQFRATLPASQAAMQVRVGDKLRIEEVDAENERVTVSLD
jgi:hypothetical protein